MSVGGQYVSKWGEIIVFASAAIPQCSGIDSWRTSNTTADGRICCWRWDSLPALHYLIWNGILIHVSCFISFDQINQLDGFNPIQYPVSLCTPLPICIARRVKISISFWMHSANETPNPCHPKPNQNELLKRIFEERRIQRVLNNKPNLSISEEVF